MRICQSEDCDRIACPCRLNFGGTPLPDLCCQHSDGFMEDLSRRVPPDEGRHGLAMWRAKHEELHAALIERT